MRQGAKDAKSAKAEGKGLGAVGSIFRATLRGKIWEGFGIFLEQGNSGAAKDGKEDARGKMERSLARPASRWVRFFPARRGRTKPDKTGQSRVGAGKGGREGSCGVGGSRSGMPWTWWVRFRRREGGDIRRLSGTSRDGRGHRVCAGAGAAGSRRDASNRLYKVMRPRPAPRKSRP